MIDVLLPFYGDPQLLQVAVRSIQRQESSGWRLIVVDDGYPDESVAEWFAALDDPRVSYFRNETNLGANLNYMRALELASADYVVMFGADDVALPNYVGNVQRALRRFPGAAVVEVGVQVIDAEGNRATPLVDRVKACMTPRAGTTRVLSGENLLVSLLRGNWTYFPSLCWRLETVRSIGFRPEFSVVQDLGMLVDVIRNGGDMVLDPAVAFQYRRHAGSDSAMKTIEGARFAEERAYFNTIASELEGAGMRRAARAARWHATSRMHAAALIASAIRTRNGAAARTLVGHILAR